MVESPPYGILFVSYTRTRKVRAWQVLGRAGPSRECESQSESETTGRGDWGRASSHSQKPSR